MTARDTQGILRSLYDSAENILRTDVSHVQERVEIIEAEQPGAGGSFVVTTENLGYSSSRILFEVDGATTLDIFYSGDGVEFGDTPSDTLTFAGSGFDLASSDVPLWASYVKVLSSADVEINGDIFRSR